MRCEGGESERRWLAFLRIAKRQKQKQPWMPLAEVSCQVYRVAGPETVTCKWGKGFAPGQTSHAMAREGRATSEGFVTRKCMNGEGKRGSDSRMKCRHTEEVSAAGNLLIVR